MRWFDEALSLTPALSRWERENCRPRRNKTASPVVAAKTALALFVFIRGSRMG
jgi:hypothetical protein